MSRPGVGMVIEKLVTVESVRIRFALDPIETIAELCLRGFELTRDEVDLFCRTDARLWFLGRPGHWRVAALTTAARRSAGLCGQRNGGNAMSIYVDSCEAQETIVVTTRSSVYELVFLRADRGDVLVRGGKYFTEFRPVVFLGSIADDGSFNRDKLRSVSA